VLAIKAKTVMKRLFRALLLRILALRFEDSRRTARVFGGVIGTANVTVQWAGV